MSTLSTHVLDAVAGAPARGMPVALSSRDDDGDWVGVHATSTDDDGRVSDLAPGLPALPSLGDLTGQSASDIKEAITTIRETLEALVP